MQLLPLLLFSSRLPERIFYNGDPANYQSLGFDGSGVRLLTWLFMHMPVNANLLIA